MKTFEDNLWADLLSRYGRNDDRHEDQHDTELAPRGASQRVDRSAPRTDLPGPAVLGAHRTGRAGRFRPAHLGLAAAAAAAAVVAAATLVHSSAPAYAVSTTADGSTTVSLQDLTALEPANAALTRVGSRVRVVPMTGDCPALDETALYRGDDWDVPVAHPDGSVTVGRVPPGYTMLLALGDYPGAELGSSFTAPVRDPAPSCLLSPTRDPSQQS